MEILHNSELDTWTHKGSTASVYSLLLCLVLVERMNDCRFLAQFYEFCIYVYILWSIFGKLKTYAGHIAQCVFTDVQISNMLASLLQLAITLQFVTVTIEEAI